jgi:tetratricopeptide (TPR) repeat protein
LKFWILAVIASTAIYGQDVGGSTGNSSVGSGAGGNAGPAPGVNRSTTTGSASDALNSRRQQEIRRPVLLSGRVITQGGDAPPESVRIDRICGGQTFAEGYTDSKGNFGFLVGQNSAILGDASMSNSAGFGEMTGNTSRSAASMGGGAGQTGITERELWNCDLRANLSGYTSQSISLAGRRLMDNSNVGILVIRKMGLVEGRTVSLTTLSAPKDAKKAYERGQKSFGKGKAEDAQKDLEKAIQLYPDFAMAHFELAKVHLQTNHEPQAIQELDAAIKADPKLEQPYLMLASIAYAKQDWETVKKHSEVLLRLNPFDYPRGYLLNAAAQLQLQQFGAAVELAQRGIKQDFNNSLPSLHHILGLALAQNNDLPGAVKELKLYVDKNPTAQNVATVKTQLAQVEKAMEDQRLAQKQ